MTKILLIGPLPNIQANKIGGARVSFSHLVQFFERKNIDFELLNTHPFELGWKRFFNPIYVLATFVLKAPKSNIIFVNMSQNGAKKIAPFFFVVSRLLGKKFIFRPFGGSMQLYFEKYSSLQKWIFRKTILKSDIFFLQTKALMNFFSKMGGQTIQLPTSRDLPDFQKQTPFQKRFVFMGHIKASKGIDLLIEAKEKLGDSVDIHLYGPIKEAKYHSIFEAKKGLYQGLLPKEKVLDKLAKYDVLVLPTHFSGEGYPGAIIEAYSIGLPVISTHWQAIPEIVEHGKTGYLIQPHSIKELIQAMTFFDKSNYQKLSKNARQYFLDHFNAEVVLEKMWTEIEILINPHDSNRGLEKSQLAHRFNGGTAEKTQRSNP